MRMRACACVRTGHVDEGTLAVNVKEDGGRGRCVLGKGNVKKTFGRKKNKKGVLCVSSQSHLL